jgi:hypothetical protein
MQQSAQGFFLIPFLGLVALYVWSLIWAFKDAERRGKPGCLIVLLVALLWPLGLVLWRIARPERRW